MINLYVDTCVISGHAKGELDARQADAVAKLLALYSRNEISLVTSTVAREELDRIPEQYRRVHDETYQRLCGIPAKEYLILDLGFGISLLPVKRHPIFDLLATVLRDEADAKHLYQAYRHGASHFLTVDVKTILIKAEEIENVCGVRPVLPSAFVNALEP